jgi:hypothetical protein
MAAFAAAHRGLALTAIGRVEALGGVSPAHDADRSARGEARGSVRAERGGRQVPLPGAHDHFAPQ